MHVPAKLEGGRRRVQGEHALQSKPVAELVFQFAAPLPPPLDYAYGTLDFLSRIASYSRIFLHYLRYCW